MNTSDQIMKKNKSVTLIDRAIIQGVYYVENNKMMLIAFKSEKEQYMLKIKLDRLDSFALIAKLLAAKKDFPITLTTVDLTSEDMAKNKINKITTFVSYQNGEIVESPELDKEYKEAMDDYRSILNRKDTMTGSRTILDGNEIREKRLAADYIISFIEENIIPAFIDKYKVIYPYKQPTINPSDVINVSYSDAVKTLKSYRTDSHQSQNTMFSIGTDKLNAKLSEQQATDNQQQTIKNQAILN